MDPSAARPPAPLAVDQCVYTSGYCEENVWHLAQHPALPAGERHVVVVTNGSRSVAMWQQRAAPPGEVVHWDYHVLLMVRGAAGPEVYDLDSRLPFPCPLQSYVAASWRDQEALTRAQRAQLRKLPAAEYVAHFSSDRSHMRTPDGGWVAPAPSWPAIGPGLTTGRWPLPRLLDVSSDEPQRWRSAAELKGMR